MVQQKACRLRRLAGITDCEVDRHKELCSILAYHHDLQRGGVRFEALGEYGAALAAFRAVETASPEWPVAIAGFVEGAAGQTAAAAATLQQLQMLSRHRFVTPYGVALVEAGLGRWDEALATLETALVERSHWLVWLRLDPRWGNLRSAPRFAHLVGCLNFPD